MMKRVNAVKTRSILHKKKRIAAVAAAMMLSASCAFAQPAVIAGGDAVGVQTQPDASAQALGWFLSGTQVEVLSESGGWAQIAIGAGNGASLMGR